MRSLLNAVISKTPAPRSELDAWERQYREHLDSAIDKLDQSLAPGRRRPRALTFDEMRALRQFVRKFRE